MLGYALFLREAAVKLELGFTIWQLLGAYRRQNHLEGQHYYVLCIQTELKGDIYRHESNQARCVPKFNQPSIYQIRSPQKPSPFSKNSKILPSFRAKNAVTPSDV